MSIKRKALPVLTKAELLEVGQEFGLEVRERMSVEEIIDVAERHFEKRGEFGLAARVTDVFGNDGIATVKVVVG